jgi:hypothetical protein
MSSFECRSLTLADNINCAFQKISSLHSSALVILSFSVSRIQRLAALLLAPSCREGFDLRYMLMLTIKIEASHAEKHDVDCEF